MENELMKAADEILEPSTHKFVRAWTFNCLGSIAKNNPMYRGNVIERLNHGLKTEPASVQATIRKALKPLASG